MDFDWKTWFTLAVRCGQLAQNRCSAARESRNPCRSPLVVRQVMPFFVDAHRMFPAVTVWPSLHDP